jgi:uncharacterized ion transporter superfamily protein YfcC
MPATKQPGFRFPSAFTILFALIVLMAVLTLIIPSGQYDRVASEALGKDVPIFGGGHAWGSHGGSVFCKRKQWHS